MSKISDLIAAEVEADEKAGELSVDAPLPRDVKVTRGHSRAQVLQVRLNEDEHRLIAKLANEQHLPVSTYVRALLLRTVGY